MLEIAFHVHTIVAVTFTERCFVVKRIFRRIVKQRMMTFEEHSPSKYENVSSGCMLMQASVKQCCVDL